MATAPSNGTGVATYKGLMVLAHELTAAFGRSFIVQVSDGPHGGDLYWLSVVAASGEIIALTPQMTSRSLMGAIRLVQKLHSLEILISAI